MNTKRALSLLAVAPLLLAAGCAVDADAPAPAPAPAPEHVGAARQADSSTDGSLVVDQLAEAGLADALGGGNLAQAFVGLLFPSDGSTGITSAELQSMFDKVELNIENQIEQVIMDDHLVDRNADVKTALDDLREWQTDRTSPNPDSYTEGLYMTDAFERLDYTINWATSYDQRESGSADQMSWLENGLGLYIYAVQVANMRSQLLLSDPGHSGDPQLDMINMLESAIPFVSKHLDPIMSNAVHTRLDYIGRCQTEDTTKTYSTWHSNFYDAYTPPGSSNPIGWYNELISDDSGTAMDRCNMMRAVYINQLLGGTPTISGLTDQVNAHYGYAAHVLETWRRTLNALYAQRFPSKQSARVMPFAFGGMFGRSSGGVTYANPVTGALTCPTGFVGHEFVGEYGVDYPADVCTNQPGSTIIEFGGMWGVTASCDSSTCSYAGTWVNPITGFASCPAGFTQTQVLGADSDRQLFYCWRNHVAGVRPPYQFGGTFGYMVDDGADQLSGGYYHATADGSTLHVNPVTQDATCPVGYKVGTVFGAPARNGFPDRPVAFCWKESDDDDFDYETPHVRLRNEATGQCVSGAAEQVCPSGPPTDPTQIDPTEYAIDTLSADASDGVPLTVRLRRVSDDTCIYGVSQAGGVAQNAPCAYDPKFTFQLVAPVSKNGNEWQLKSVATGMCLYASGSTIYNAACASTNTNQVFVLDPVAPVQKVQIRNPESATVNECFAKPTANVTLRPCSANPNFAYYLDPVGTGHDAQGNQTVRLRNSETDTCLAANASGALLTGVACDVAPSQTFRLVPLSGGGYHMIANALNTCVVDVGGDNGTAYTEPCANSTYMTFYFDAVQ